MKACSKSNSYSFISFYLASMQLYDGLTKSFLNFNTYNAT